MAPYRDEHCPVPGDVHEESVGSELAGPGDPVWRRQNYTGDAESAAIRVPESDENSTRPDHVRQDRIVTFESGRLVSPSPAVKRSGKTPTSIVASHRDK
jgi:hypothetical protein